MLQEHSPAEPEQKIDRTPDNPPEAGQPNADLPEVAPVALHNGMQSEDMSVHVLETETHPPAEPEQEIDPTPDSPPELGQPNPGLPEMAPPPLRNDVNLEEIPVHVLGLNAIKKGAPIARGGMFTVFNGKYGPIPVALKQAVDSVQVLVNEAVILRKIQHPNVIQAYGIWKNANEEVFMVYVTF